MGFANFHLGRYEEALDALLRIITPAHHLRLLAATYAHLGQLDEARIAARQFLDVCPTFSVSRWASTEPYIDDSELKRYVDGLRMAGLPD